MLDKSRVDILYDNLRRLNDITDELTGELAQRSKQTKYHTSKIINYTNKINKQTNK